MRGKREFNIEQKVMFLDSTKKGKEQVAYFYKKVKEWTCQYQKFATSGVASSANSYFGGLDNSLNKGAQNIEKIYTAAEEAELDLAEKFGQINIEISAYSMKIKALLSVLQPVGPVANVFNDLGFAERLAKAQRERIQYEIHAIIYKSDGLENLDLANIDAQAYIGFITDKYRGQDMFGHEPKISDAERDLLIKCYEYLNPQNAAIMNSFLQDVIEDGNYNFAIQDIKYLIYASPKLYSTVLFHYLPEIKIIDFKSGGPYGYWGENTEPEWFSQSLLLDLGAEYVLDNRVGTYNGVFHELGHAIDDMMRKSGVFIRHDSALQDILRNDLHNNLRNEISKIPNTLSKKQIDDIINSFAVGGTKLGAGSEEARIRDELIARMHDVINGNETISDVVGGFTGNTINGGIIHDLVYINDEGKEVPSYFWTDENGKETGMQSCEWFAGYFASSITGYVSQKEDIYSFFPNGTKYMDEELARVAHEIKS